MPCTVCDDGFGECVYPYFGVSPHRHDLTKTGSVIGSTVIEPRSTWPANFAPGEEDGGGLGVYTHCLNCGAPDHPADSEGPDDTDKNGH